MFDTWHDFFLLTGPASSSLLGLLFVVMTLTSGYDQQTAGTGTRIYTTPTVFHLVVVVALSGGALAPQIPTVPYGTAVIIAAVIGLFYCGFVGREIRRGHVPGHWLDFWFYGVLVAVVYAALLGAGILVVRGAEAAPWALAGGVLALLLAAVHNAWDLVTWIAPRSKRP